MKMNVATRVIAGFSVVTLLIIILGAVTLMGNNSIKTGSHTLQEMSLPALEKTASLSQSLASQQISYLLGYYSEKSSDIPSIEQRIKNDDTQFQNTLNSLSQTISQEASLKQPLSQLRQAFEVYENHSANMLAERVLALTKQESLINRRGD